MSSPTKRLTLIDASGFIFRAFFALPRLTRADGTPTGAVMGYLNMVLKLLRDKRSDEVEDYFAAIFDAGRVTFRNEMYADYKANRDEPPEELRSQFALVREATEALRLPVIELPGYEADDVIASYARAACAEGYEVVIVSSDKDLMQLVAQDGCITLYDAMKDKPIDAAAVFEKFGVQPDKVGDVLALMGDSSDNIPGVPGIGPKTAAQLIDQFGDLESLLAQLHEIPQQKRREVLIEHAENARLSRRLVSLVEDVPLPLPLAECRLGALDIPALLPFVKAMGFHKLEERLLKESGQVAEPAAPSASQPDVALPRNYQLLADADALGRLSARIMRQGHVALNPVVEQGELAGLSLCLKAGEAFYLPLDLQPAAPSNDLFATAGAPQSWALAGITGWLSDAAILKICPDAKALKKLLAPHGLALQPYDDVTLLSYVLFAGINSHSLQEMAHLHCNFPLQGEDAVRGKGKSRRALGDIAPQELVECLAEQADATLRLWQAFKPQLPKNHVTRVYETMERPLVEVLSKMEQRGVMVDRQRLRGLSDEFAAQMRQLEQAIYREAGREFLLGSPKQLGEVLFDVMGMPGGKRSKKSGQYATGAEVLEELAAQGHKVAASILQWRQYDKLRNTYTEALERQINPETGRVHTTYVQAIAATGRLSSTEPNLQNIPIRTEEGKRIRHAFIPAPGYALVSADYSQIELRLLAEMADIETLQQAFRDGRDIHAATASDMFGVPLDAVTGELRRRAKTINFGIIYGISAHGLAVRLGIDRATAAQFIEAYFKNYPGIQRYMEEKKNEAREFGYITTLFGRKVHIAGINDKQFNLRGFAERQAINAPLQGTAADIIKRAMIALDREIERGGWPVRMLLQVHDELVFEIEEGRAAEFTPRIQAIMENAATLAVPLKVEAGIGADWGAIH